MSKNGIGDACSTADIIDCLLVYLWSTSGLLVPQTATDHHGMLLNANAIVYTGLNGQKLKVDGMGSLNPPML